MPTYQYRAYYSTGEEVCDTVEMDSMEGILAWLKDHGLECHEIEALEPIPNTLHAPAEPQPTALRTPLAWAFQSGTIDRSIDRSIDSEPEAESTTSWSTRLGRAGLEHPCRGTGIGHEAIELLGAMVRQRVRLDVAAGDLAQALGRCSLGSVLSEFAEALRCGTGVAEAMQLQREDFGDVSIAFVRLGEQRWGIAESLRRYLAMREMQRARCGWRIGARISRRTRRFAVNWAYALDLSSDVLQSLRCAGIELSRGDRKAVVVTLDRLRNGESLADALPRKSLLTRGFESEFIGMVRAGEASSVLSEALRLAACI